MCAASVVGWQVLTEESAARPEPDQPTRIDTVETDAEVSGSSLDNGFEWIVTEPSVDLGYLADVHASSRLQYDECQQNFAQVATEPSSGRHPLYFC